MTVKQNIIAPLAALPHAKEVQGYLINLTSAITPKLKPSTDLIHDLSRPSQIFVCESDLKETLNGIRRIFETDGYMTPWDLENKLIRSYHPRIPAQAFQRADHYSAAEMEPDHLTGYMHKTQVPLVMGFAALYNQITGKPVTCFEIDYTNMRGTNEHFAKVLSCAERKPIKGAIMTEAMTMTDQSAFVLASIIQGEVIRGASQIRYKNKRDEPHIIALRTGGDEIRLVAVNVDEKTARDLLPQIHISIEYAAAAMGLHDHIHTKRPLDPWSRGFGACATTFPLEANGDYKAVIAKADQQIQNLKIATGQIRINNAEYERLKPEFSSDADLYSNPDKAQIWLAQSMRVIAELRDVQPPSTFASDHNDTPTLEDIAAAHYTGHFLTMREIQANLHDHLIQDLENTGTTLTESELRALHIKFMKFPSIDYASGTLMERDLPAAAGAALATIDQINRKFGVNLAPWTIGVSFHNLSGLNEVLGHENANIILHHMVHQIMIPELNRVGIGKDNVVMAHMGGGEFRMIIQPVIPDTAGKPNFIDAKTISRVFRDIQNRNTLSSSFGREARNVTSSEFRTGLEPRIDKLNTTPIAEILQRYNQPCPQHLRDNVLGDIENPREEYQPFENGITMTFAARQYQPNSTLNTRNDRRGGAIVAFIGTLLHDAIQDRRQGMINDKIANESRFAPLPRASQFDQDLF